MSGVDLEAVSARADQATREPIADMLQEAMEQGAEPGDAVSAVLAGMSCAIATLAWAFRPPGQSPDQVADVIRTASLSFLQQCEISDAGGGSA